MVGSQSVLMLLGVVLLLFGGRKLPELAGALGRSMTEFRKGVEQSHADKDAEAAPRTPEADPATTGAPATEVAAVPATPPCASCGAALQPDWAHCPKCGAIGPADRGRSAA